MSTTLNDGDFELDGSLLLRSSKSPLSPVSIQTIDMGGMTVNTQNQSNPMGDNTIFGVDRYSAPEWTFTLNCRGGVGEALDGAEQVRTYWQNDSIRLMPGATSVLRYKLNGRTRRIYGRCGNVSPNVASLMVSGATTMLVAFQLEDPNTYDDTESQVVLDLITQPGGGVTLPAVMPWVWGSTPGKRQGVVDVFGSASTPMRVVVHGPSAGKLTSPSISGPGWKIEFPGQQVAYDQTLTIDTRAKTATINGASVAGTLARGSALSSRLQVGTQELVFSCSDPTNTAYATVYWRSAYRSL